ncbi:MAG: hypothetical protein HQ596_04530 [Candidatus Saganbacteria bacterium]|nr:hypothetical protein [Candidatus Saganbacteria bacterium]
MRKLIYVPIIHMSADLGSIAAEADKKGIAICGEERWNAHKQTIASYWDELAAYFGVVDPKGFKIYQDGLVADGEVGMKIVADGVKRGSKNYEIIDSLIKKGATLIKTEDIEIVMKEYKAVKELAGAKSFVGKSVAYLKYVRGKDKILQERDSYIARRIGETLKEGETGILFIGAHHNIIDGLPKDIKVVELKDRDKVMRYMKGYYLKSRQPEISQLAEYLKEPIPV